MKKRWFFTVVCKKEEFLKRKNEFFKGFCEEKGLCAFLRTISCIYMCFNKETVKYTIFYTNHVYYYWRASFFSV